MKRIWFALFALLLLTPATSIALSYSMIDLGMNTAPQHFINNEGQYVIRTPDDNSGYNYFIGSEGKIDASLGDLRVTNLNDFGYGYGVHYGKTPGESRGFFTYADGEATFYDDFKNFIPTDINNNNEIVGYFQGIDFERGDIDTYESYLFRDGTFTPITDYYVTVAYAINNSGQIVGRYGENPALFENGEVKILGGLDERGIGEAYDINDNGTIVGVSVSGDRSPVIFAGDQAIPITDLKGNAKFVNNSDLIVGSVMVDWKGKNFIYQDGEFNILEDLIIGFDDSWFLSVVGLNDANQMIGNLGREGQWSAVLLNPMQSPAPVPEPATFLLLGSSIAGFAITRIRKKA